MEKIRIFALLASGAFLWSSLPGCSKGQGQVVLLNKTGVTIERGKLQVGSEAFPIVDLKAGESVRFPFKSAYCRKCQYKIGLTLSDHRSMAEALGLLRKGMDYDDSLVVEKARIILESRQNPSGNKGSLFTSSQEKKIQWVLVQ